MAAHISIATASHDGHDVMNVEGEIDLATAPELDAELSRRVGDGNTIVDLSSVTFIDSTGLRVLLTAHEMAEAAGGKVMLVTTEGPVTRLFSITGVDDLLNVHSSLDAAVADA